jgi:uncharacterized protein
MNSTGATTATAPTVERIEALDVLRGVAVAGILFANVLVFFGIFAITPERAAALPTASRDSVALFLWKVLVDGKFYSVFSLLFGIGFGLQLARGGDEVLPRFRRRLRILLAIGAGWRRRRSAYPCWPSATRPRSPCWWWMAGVS